MSDSLVGRTAVRAINRFVLRLSVLALVVAIVLFATGRNATAIGVLVCPFVVGFLALQIKRTVRLRDATLPRPTGVSVGAALSAVPGAIMIWVGILIGGDFIGFVSAAMGTSLIAMSALVVALVKSLQSA